MIGASPSKTFRRTDGVRTGSQVWTEAKAASIGNTAAAADIHDQDIADTLSSAWFIDGSTQPSADLPMNGKKLTGHGSATARTHLPIASQVQDGSFIYGGTATGTSNAYAISLTPAITAYADGMIVLARVSANNSGVGATTLTVNSVGAKRCTRSDGLNLQSSDLVANRIYPFIYNSTTDTWNVAVNHYQSSGSINGLITTAIAATIGVTVQAYDVDTLKSDTSRTLTAGYVSTAVSDGTKSSGTYTPDPSTGSFREATNNGAHTLAPPSNTGSLTMIVEYTNGASAGAITTSGWTKVTGDTFTTTNGNKFKCYIAKGGTGTHLHIQAMQ